MSKTALIPQKAAVSLRTAELKLEAIESEYKQAKAPLEAKIKDGRERLLLAMQKTGIKTIKLESGDVYMRVRKTTFKVTDEDRAFEWGRNHGCIKLDKIAANSILVHTIGVPEGFEQEDKEFISIKRNNEISGKDN